MKIAITSDLYYPMMNGVAVFAHNLAHGLAKRGHEVMVFCPSFTGKEHKHTQDGVTVVSHKSVRVPLYPDAITPVGKKKEVLGIKMPRVFYKNGIWAATYPYPTMKKELQKFQPDVIHNQTAETVALAAQTYAQRYDVPMVSTGHAYPDNITGQFKALKPIKKPLDAMLRAYMASFLKHSEYATMPTELAIHDLVPKNRKRFKVPVEPLSNGVDLTQFSAGKAPDEIYEKYNLPKNRPIVLYVGRVDPEKSIEYPLQAFAKVHAKIPEALMVIVGDGTAREKLEKMAIELGIADDVRFLGKIVLPELADVYRIGSLFVTASETETQGIVLIEALASGLPLVAVDAGAVSELCQDGKDGILCQPKDVNGLAKAMIKILQDKDLCKRYSKAGLEIANFHDLNRTLTRFEEIYKEAIASKNHASA